MANWWEDDEPVIAPLPVGQEWWKIDDPVLEPVQKKKPREYEAEIQAAKASRNAVQGEYGFGDHVIDSGLLMGFGDEIAGFAGGLGGLVRSAFREGEGFGKGYTVAAEAARDRQAEYSKKYPVRSVAGSLLGGAATGLGLMRHGLTFMPRAASAGFGRRVAGSAADAAAAGVVGGYASGTDAQDRVDRALTGAGVGATIGTALPVAGKLLSPVVNQIGSRINPKGHSLMAFGSELATHGRTMADVAKGMRSAAREGYGQNWTLADETADQTRSLFSGVAQAPSAARDAAYKELLERQEGQGERIVSELERLGGDARTAKEVYEATDLTRRATNTEWFDRVRSDATKVNPTPIVEKIDEHIHLGPKPTRAQQTENKVAAMLGEVVQGHPVPNNLSSAYYRTAYEKDVLRDIEKIVAQGTHDNSAIGAMLESKLPDMRPTDRTKLVKEVKWVLDIPPPTDSIFENWRMDTLDRIIHQEKFEATKGLPSLPNDQIAKVLREVRSLFEDKGGTIDTFGHVWRARENIEDIIQRSGLIPPTGPGQKPTYNALGTKLKDVRDTIDAELAKSSPLYKEAMKKAREGREALKAIERGAEMASKGRARNNIVEFNKLAPENQQGLRVGYTDAIAERIEGAASKNQLPKIRSPKRRAELRAFAATRARANRFDRARNREETMWSTFEYPFGGSPTARRLAEQDEVPLLFQPEIVSSIFTGNFGQAGRHLLNRIAAHSKGYTPAVREEIIKLLMTKNSKADLDRITAELQQAMARGESRNELLGRLLRAGYGGGAAEIGAETQ